MKAKELAQAAISKAADLLKQKADSADTSDNNIVNIVEGGQEKNKGSPVQIKKVELPHDAKSCENKVATPSSGKGGHQPKTDT